MERLAALFRDGVGVALLVDYGGNSRHLVDSRSLAPHVRIYGPDRALHHTNQTFERPGAYDITFDVDFTDLGHLAEAHGLAMRFFGQQSALEQPPIDIWSKENQPMLIGQASGCRGRGHHGGSPRGSRARASLP